MIRDEEHWLSITDAFHAAALGSRSWYSALEGLADATGSQMGQLIGLGTNAAVPFNLVTNVPSNFAAEFAATGGGDSAVNPRVKAGMAAPVLKALAESDFTAPEDYKHNAHLQEVARRWDIAYICLTTLERRNGMVIGLAVGRSRRVGHITDGERACFTSIAPHVRAAVRTQLALEGQGAALVAGTMEVLSIPAFVCDRHGRVQALTPSAERLVAGGRGLELRRGELHARRSADARLLSAAIRRAASGLTGPAAPPHQTVLIGARYEGSPPLVLDVIALPQRWQHELAFTSRALVVARGETADADAARGRRSALLRGVYGLTDAEVHVALCIAAGQPAKAIAASRGASLETVRTQIKAVRSKLRVNRQIELVARINQL